MVKLKKLGYVSYMVLQSFDSSFPLLLQSSTKALPLVSQQKAVNHPKNTFEQYNQLCCFVARLPSRFYAVLPSAKC
jgi:hypothetical protein